MLAAFTERIPLDEREQLLAHLPDDARRIAAPPRRHGPAGAPGARGDARHPRTVSELVAAVASASGVDTKSATAATQAIVAELRLLVPEESDDVAAVLPAELRSLWTANRGLDAR